MAKPNYRFERRQKDLAKKKKKEDKRLRKLNRKLQATENAERGGDDTQERLGAQGEGAAPAAGADRPGEDANSESRQQ